MPFHCVPGLIWRPDLVLALANVPFLIIAAFLAPFYASVLRVAWLGGGEHGAVRLRCGLHRHTPTRRGLADKVGVVPVAAGSLTLEVIGQAVLWQAPTPAAGVAGRFTPQALLCTDPVQNPEQILRWFIQRWQLEATFQGQAATRSDRAHLGVETQRQWSPLAIARITPCLLGLFSLVTLLVAQLSPKARRAVLTATWYRKRHPTFSDTLAAVRRHIWQEQGFVTSHRPGNMRKLSPALQNGITYALCHVA